MGNVTPADIRSWFFEEGWLIIAMFPAWLLLTSLVDSIFKGIRNRNLGTNRISRFFLIKLDAAAFLVRWSLALAFIAIEAYLVYRAFAHFSPTVARHSPSIRRWLHNLRRVGIILICIVTARRLSSVFAEAVLSRVSGDTRSTSKERELRIKTLVGALNGVINTLLVIAGIVLIIWQIDDKNLLAPLLTGAGLVGVVVAFGAQSLMRDFFSGFFILLENQYKIGDVIKIGDRTGTVEHVSMRITTLRDEHGSLHIIPNGEIKSVTNMSFGWAQAVVDFTLPYFHDPEGVRAILEQQAAALRGDDEFRPLILDEPNVLGIQSTAGTGVVYRVAFKTRAFDQWSIAREYRRRVLIAFVDSNIPFLPPQPLQAAGAAVPASLPKF